MDRQKYLTIERFLAGISNEELALQKKADLVSQFIRERLVGSRIDFLEVSSRVKDEHSRRLKVLKKEYDDPGTQLTDLVACRIVLFHGDDVDSTASTLRNFLSVREDDSVDKRKGLGFREFGYRSVHLVASPKPEFLKAEFSSLALLTFEIQVRSVLEHAWAEIEHEVVYKSGVNFSDEFRRNFAAVAGTLEILEEQFARLRQRADDEIEIRRATNAGSQLSDEPLDAAGLMVLLDAARPRALRWSTRPGRNDLTRASLVSSVSALASVGVDTTKATSRALNSAKVVGLIDRFSAANDQTPDEVSHLHVAFLIVLSRSKAAARAWLPDLFSSRLFDCVTARRGVA